MCLYILLLVMSSGMQLNRHNFGQCNAGIIGMIFFKLKYVVYTNNYCLGYLNFN